MAPCHIFVFVFVFVFVVVFVFVFVFVIVILILILILIVSVSRIEKVMELLDNEAVEQLCQDRPDLVLTVFHEVEKLPVCVFAYVCCC